MSVSNLIDILNLSLNVSAPSGKTPLFALTSFSSQQSSLETVSFL